MKKINVGLDLQMPVIHFSNLLIGGLNSQYLISKSTKDQG